MALTGATVISWSSTTHGREAKALEVFGNALQHYEQLTKDGRIHGHKEFFSLDDGGGFILLTGEVDELLRLRGEQQTIDLLADANAIVDGLSVRSYLGGSDQTVGDQMARYTERMRALGYL